jgi:hypothetical protein
MQYQIIFEECNGYKQGEIVSASQVSPSVEGIAYLLKLGAITEVKVSESPAKIEDRPKRGKT